MTERSEYNYEEWLQLISDSLKSGTIDELYKSREGLDIKPFLGYQREGSPALKKQSPSWLIGVSFDEENPQKLNAEILDFLKLGAQAIRFNFDAPEALKTILNGVNTDWIYTDLHAQQLTGLPTDLFGPEARGAAHLSTSSTAQNFHALSIRSKASNSIESLVDICQQISEALSNSVHPQSISLSLSVDSYMPVSISKLRAIRILWLNLLKQHQLPLIPAFISCEAISHAEDPNIGLIELSCSAVNAVFGGCDVLYLNGSGFDQNAKRLAMNIQHIFKMESKLDRVMDPLAGSYNIEDLTNQIAEKVWDQL